MTFGYLVVVSKNDSVDYLKLAYALALSIKNTQRKGFDKVALVTDNIEDVEKIAPGVIANPDRQNRGRLIWKNQVYRPYAVQERGIVAERFTLLVVDCIQVMPEEMVNDPQFLAYAN